MKNQIKESVNVQENCPDFQRFLLLQSPKMRIVRLREEEDSSFVFRTMSVKTYVRFSLAKAKQIKSFKQYQSYPKKRPIFKIQQLSGLSNTLT